MGDWSKLIPDLLIKITERITFHEDLMSFAGVCKSWQHATTIFNVKPSRFPCLMLADHNNNDENHLRSFFYLSNGGVTRKVSLPEARNKRCLSSHGWLLIVEKDNIKSKLYHPFTKQQIGLPRLDTLRNHDRNILPNNHIIKKVIFSSNPSLTSDFWIIVLYGGRSQLGFCKPQHDSWTTPLEEWKSVFFDLNWHNDNLYIVDYHSRIVTYDLHLSIRTNLALVSVGPSPNLPIYGTDSIYLLGQHNNNSKLLVILRYIEIFYCEDDYEDAFRSLVEQISTKSFRVFEFDLRDGRLEELKSLGDKAVFVGYNSSFSMDADADDDVIMADCIYFTDDSCESYTFTLNGGGTDMGIYHMCDGSIEAPFGQDSCSKITPPTWVGPYNF